MSGDIFRVVFGPRTPAEYRPELEQVARDLNDCGIEGTLSQNIQRDAPDQILLRLPHGGLRDLP